MHLGINLRHSSVIYFCICFSQNVQDSVICKCPWCFQQSFFIFLLFALENEACFPSTGGFVTREEAALRGLL